LNIGINRRKCFERKQKINKEKETSADPQPIQNKINGTNTR